MDARPRQVQNYETADGRSPFEEWMATLIGNKIHGIILNRLDRVQAGNLGDWGAVGEGVCELRFDFGPGYRVYFGQDGDQIILLAGGTKAHQSRDIKRAKEYWRDYNA